MSLDQVPVLQADSGGADIGDPVAKRARALRLSLALGDYDRTRALLYGQVGAEGLKLKVVSAPIGEFCVRPVYEEYDVAETSFSWYVAARSRGEKVIALPIFPLRMAVLGYMFVRTDSPYKSPRDLIGKRVATSSYRATVNLWLRGIMKDHWGVTPDQIKWVTVRPEAQNFIIPEGVSCTQMSDRKQGELLLSGEVDAVMGPEAPPEFNQGHPGMRRLLPDSWGETRDYFTRTRIFPITHTVVMSERLYKKKPWIAERMLGAFTEAQKACDTFHLNSKHLSFPDAEFFMEQQRNSYGPDSWKHGIAANRHNIETFTRYAFEQGYTVKHQPVEELFTPTLLGS
ncbi:MAG: ABC transporter substrate-binding protein [Betaproteobacteria bacterium]|nr:ABC transporter substrate-binding protein [Betaproteobacteria bacterium]